MHRFALAVAVFAIAVSAQGPRGPVAPDDLAQFDSRYRDFTTLVVKFDEGTRVRLRGHHWVDLAGGSVDAANALVADAVAVSRLFLRPEADLDAERAALLRDLPRGLEPPADLNLYYHVDVADAATGRALLVALQNVDCIETVFPEHLPTVPCDPGDIPPFTPDFSSQQTWRDPAPMGVDHRASRVLQGGRGRGMQIVDVESSWQLDHEDIPQLVQANVIGPHTMSLNPNHGVATIGELAGEWDAHGITGLVDLTALKVHSHQRQFWASAVNTAAANSPVGGFIMLEVQLTVQGHTVPMEVREDVFDAVRNATMAGKFVVAAAGNGSEDLDAAVFNNLFNRSFRDSGSIIVGATNGSALVRASFSNYGSIVDANGWGQNVTTTGYGDLFSVPGDPRQSYTAVFSGTSSATPMVTGSSMALVGALRTQTGRLLTPSELRTLLRTTGTPVPNGRIGARPDLVQLLAAVGLPDGLDLTTEARLGGTMTVALSGPASANYALAAAVQTGFVDLGAAGRFLLDPSNTVIAFAGVVPPSGTLQLQLNVPNQMTLVGSDLHLQAGLVDQGVLELTSAVQNHVY